MSIVFTGMQPSGVVHLGNYLGMVKPLMNLQENKNYQIFCSIVDLHALTVWQNPEDLSNNTLQLAATLIASGFDVEKHTLFIQSHVKEHTELAWILGCTSRFGWLNRMTQFKEKSGSNRENASAALFFYPVLMAADILLYNADLVPTGEDQKQHLEFTRDTAMKFNHDYQQEVFVLPTPLIAERARIMSLRDGTKKMSKSDPSEYGKILFTDTEEVIRAKFMKAKTDSGAMPQSQDELENRPEIANLLNIYVLTGMAADLNEAMQKFKGCNFSEAKAEIATAVVNLINPVRLRYNEIVKDKARLERVLAKGAEQARATASKNMKRVKQAVGFY